jgi:multimeric flavodoxin WrbA
MRIVAINGSHRGDQGHCRALLDRIGAGAASKGAELEVVTLAKLKMRRCVACATCQLAERRHRCVYQDADDVAAVFDKMRAADVVIYASPIYLFQMSSLMKCFLDRFYGIGDSGDLRVTRSGLLFHEVDHAVCSKPFVALLCCDNLEDETPRNAIAYFETFSKFLDAPQVGLLVRNGGALLGHGRDPVRCDAATAEDVARAFEQAGEELATRGRISWLTERRARREVVPVPLFSILKKVPSRRLRNAMLERARAMMGSAAGVVMPTPASRGPRDA